MKLLQDYFKLQGQIHDYFGYVEDWVVIPLQDCTRYYWMIAGPEDKSTTPVVYSDDPLTLESVTEGKTIYSGPIYTQCFLNQWVYREADCTMVCVDTRTDGNKFLMVFDNKMECKDEKIAKAYIDNWG